MRIRSLVFAATAFVASGSLGAIIHDTFGPSSSYSYTKWHTATPASSVAKTSALAVPFTVPTTSAYALHAVILAVRWDPVGLPLATLTVRADNMGLPGAAIETRPLLALFSAQGSATQITLFSQTHPKLSPGATYWVELAADPGVAIHWYDNLAGAGGFLAGSAAGGWKHDASPARQPVLRIDARPIPAPGPAALALTGLVALSARRRRAHTPNGLPSGGARQQPD